MAEWLRRLLPILLLLVLAACSSTRLAYQHADWLIVRQLDRQLDLDRAQQQWLRNEVDTHFDWHCRTQLPRYREWLETHRTLLAKPHVTPAELAAALVEAEPLLAAIAEALLPTAVALLRDLTPAQVAHLEHQLARRNDKLARKYTSPPLSRVVERRSRDLERRLRPWSGRLSAEQRELIAAWSAAQGDFNVDWLASRERWQAVLLETLAAPHSPRFESNLRELLTAPAAIHEPAWNRRVAASHEAGLALAAELLNSATPAQRTHLSRRLDALAADLAALSCPPASSIQLSKRSP